MKDSREEYYDSAAKVRIVIADATAAAGTLARSHLCGPASAYFLAQHLAAAAALAADIADSDEVLSLQMACSGPLGGLSVECTAAGTLRGFTNVKILDDFDALGKPDSRRILGEKRYQITRSVPGRIVSQGLATTLGGYLTQSLQRNAEIKVEAAVSDEVEVTEARAILVEALPDSPLAKEGKLCAEPLARLSLAASSRTLLKKLGFPSAELKKSVPLSFACSCSAERARAMIDALPPDERASLPSPATVTCHMCGRSWVV